MTTSSVPDFMKDEDYSDQDDNGVEYQPGIVEPPENSSEHASAAVERAASVAKSASVGAVRRPDPAEFNPVLTGDQEEFDGEQAPERTQEQPEAPTGKEWKERVAAGEVKGYEHPSRGRNPDSPTKKRENGSTYRRKKLGEKDFRVLGFLLLHEFITTKQVGILRDLSVPSARRLMLGLQELGVIGQEKFDFGQQLWYLTGKGLSYARAYMDIPDAAQPLHRSGHFDISKIRPNLLGSHVAAQLMAGTDTIRPLISVPLSTGLDLLPFLIPESYIRSEFTKALQKKGHKGGFESGKERGRAIQNVWMDIKENRRDGQDEQSLMKEHPELWTVVGRTVEADSREANYFHPADLFLNLSAWGERGPGSVAVEIELSMKNEDKQRKILTTYFRRQDPSPVGLVVYLTNQKSIAERVTEIAQEIYDEMLQQKNKPDAQREKQQLIRVALLKDADGKLFSGNVWDL